MKKQSEKINSKSKVTFKKHHSQKALQNTFLHNKIDNIGLNCLWSDNSTIIKEKSAKLWNFFVF